MREEHKFTLALALAYVVNIAMKIVFSVFAFHSFGSDTNQVILNNLPEGAFRMSISFVFVASCLLSCALPLHQVFDLLQTSEVFKNTFSKIPIFGSFLLRITVFFATVLVAILVPKFALVVSFVGSITSSLPSYIFPCPVHLKMKFKQLKTYEVLLNLLLIVIGTVVLIFGVIFSGMALFMG